MTDRAIYLVPPPRLALNQKESAAALGVSVPHFVKHIRPYLRAVYLGGAMRYPVMEIQRFLDKEASNSEYPYRRR